MTSSLSNVNLFVQDLERAQRFYTQVLGLRVDLERSSPPSFALLQAGGCTLTLQDASTPGAVLAPAESVELGFKVEDVDLVRERLSQWDVEVGQVQQMGWGTALEARDLDGHRLNVFRMRN